MSVRTVAMLTAGGLAPCLSSAVGGLIERYSEIARTAASTKVYRVLKFRLRIAGPCTRGSRGNCLLTYIEVLMVLRLFRLC